MATVTFQGAEAAAGDEGKKKKREILIVGTLHFNIGLISGTGCNPTL